MPLVRKCTFKFAYNSIILSILQNITSNLLLMGCRPSRLHILRSAGQSLEAPVYSCSAYVVYPNPMRQKRKLLMLFQTRTWEYADFFPGEGKIFQGAGLGAKTYYFTQKAPKKYYFPPKKSKNILFCPAGRGGGQGPPLALPCGRLWT